MTAEQVAASQAAAASARQYADSQATLLAQESAKIAELQAKADDAQAAAAVAAEVAVNAAADAEREQAKSQAAAATADARRTELGRWASATYRSGTSAGASDLLTLMRSSNTDDLAQNLQAQQAVGRWRGATSKQVNAAFTAQKQASDAASSASAEAESAKRAADEAQRTADDLLAQQQAQIDQLTATLTASMAAASAAQQQAGVDQAALAAQQAAEAARQVSAARGSASAAVPAANAAAQAAAVAALTPGSVNERIIATASSLTGISYVWGGTTPAGFDCSGYTSYVYRQVGLSIPRTARAQQAYLTPVSDPQPGDLVFFGNPAHHVGIYAGGGMMYDSPHSGSATSLRRIYSGVAGYGRLG